MLRIKIIIIMRDNVFMPRPMSTIFLLHLITFICPSSFIIKRGAKFMLIFQVNVHLKLYLMSDLLVRPLESFDISVEQILFEYQI